MSTTYYALIGTSKDAADAVRWTVTARNSEMDIIGLAEEECRLSGEDLEFFAGFELIGSSRHAGGIGCEELAWSRDWMPGEKFKASLLKLNDDERTYKIFDDAKREQVEEFLAKAKAVGLLETALALVARFSQPFTPPKTGD
jgi:hypothetical protein